MSPKQLFALVALLLPVLAVPAPRLAVSKVARAVPGRYIVTLKNGVSRAAHVSSISSETMSTSSKVTHQYSIINGYSGEFSTDDLDKLRSHSDVSSIEEDGTSRAFDIETQEDAPWGLARISSEGRLTGESDADLDFEYKYDSTGGAGTVVYVVDTGIYVDHPDFGDRASWGKTFGGYPDEDENGHGTHCAGTAVSEHFGVAKSAEVIAVKVLDQEGDGLNSDIIAGLDWVADQVKGSGKPSVASLSLGGDVSDSLDEAVVNLFNSGVTIVVAAGNDAEDADNVSPAHVPQVITVGACNFNDEMADFSNFGASLDLFAPGENITSTWIDGKTETISGTSMATPHVAGYAAYLLGLDSTLSPVDITSTIGSNALSNVISGIPVGTPNKLLNNGL